MGFFNTHNASINKTHNKSITHNVLNEYMRQIKLGDIVYYDDIDGLNLERGETVAYCCMTGDMYSDGQHRFLPVNRPTVLNGLIFGAHNYENNIDVKFGSYANTIELAEHHSGIARICTNLCPEHLVHTLGKWYIPSLIEVDNYVKCLRERKYDVNDDWHFCIEPWYETDVITSTCTATDFFVIPWNYDYELDDNLKTSKTKNLGEYEFTLCPFIKFEDLFF